MKSTVVTLLAASGLLACSCSASEATAPAGTSASGVVDTSDSAEASTSEAADPNASAGSEASDVPVTNGPVTVVPTTALPTTASSTVETTEPPVPPTVPPDLGLEVGSAAIGPSFDVRQPWPVGTIYVDLEPGAIVVDFVPPEPGCIAAEVTATVGRGGAIRVDLFVDGERESGAECADGAIGNDIVLALPDAIRERGFYTTTTAATGGASAEAEAVADAVIGLPVDEAIELIADGGFLLRDLTDAETVAEDFNSGRVNITTLDGFVVGSTVG